MRRAALILMVLVLAGPAAAAGPDFSALVPDLPIERLAEGPIRQDRAYEFRLSAEALTKTLTALVKQAAGRQGLPPDDFSAEVNGLDAVAWHLVDEDLTRVEIKTHFPELVVETGLGTGSGVSTLRYAFFNPTDPGEGYVLVAAAKFRWNALRNTTPLFPQPVACEALGKLHLQVLDLDPPRAARFEPDTLHGFCGGSLAGFNAEADRRGAATGIPRNPDTLVLTFFDDNPHGYSPVPGVLHDKSKVAAWLLLETVASRYAKSGRGAAAGKPAGPSPRDPFDLAATIDEEPAEPASAATDDAGAGAFRWTAPIPVAEIPGSSVAVERFGPEAGKKRVGYRVSVPLAGLDAWLAEKAPEFAKLPLHYAAYARARIPDPAAAGRDPAFLRFTFAVSDSSGNFAVPSAALVPEAAVRERFAELYARVNGGRTEPTLAEHDYAGKIVPLDAIRPNPVAVVTNTRRGVTAIFTVPNGDLAPAPYANDEAEWVFSAEGGTPAMDALPGERRKELADLLTVAEGDRLVFSILAYDNVSKEYVDPSNAKAPAHGIATPLVGDGPGLLRYVTFRINDAGALSKEDYVESETGGAEIHRYPDYIFRKAAAGEQSVSFYVHDFSLFRDPSLASGAAFGPDALARANRRALKLLFKVVPAGTAVEKLGNQEKTK